MELLKERTSKDVVSGYFKLTPAYMIGALTSQLGTSNALVLFHIASMVAKKFDDMEDGADDWPPVRMTEIEISKMCGLKQSTVNKSLKELREKKWIRIEDTKSHRPKLDKMGKPINAGSLLLPDRERILKIYSNYLKQI